MAPFSDVAPSAPLRAAPAAAGFPARARRGRRRGVTRWLHLCGAGAALWLGALGCTSDARRAEQARVANLAERIDRLRRADNADKRPLLKDLERAECAGADACALKDLCVRAYRLHQQGLDAIAALSALARADAGAGANVSGTLSAAERDLAQARELAQLCSEEQVRTVRKTML